MDNLKKYLRTKGIYAVIAAAMLIAVLLGAEYYMDIKDDDEEARKLVDRELRIAEMKIMWELWDIEAQMSDLAIKANQRINQPNRMLSITNEIIQQSDLIFAVAIGFVPDFYKTKGYWFEPRSKRINGEIFDDQIGGPDHDYFKMSWYSDCVRNYKKHTNHKNQLQWTSPYVVNDRNSSYVVSLTRPLLTDDDELAGVMCIDMSLSSMKKLVGSVKPYSGTICQLFDDDGNLIVSSDMTHFDESDYFITEKKIANNSLLVRLACPKKEIYGTSATDSMIAIGITLVGLLLLAYIVQRTVRTIVRLDAAYVQSRTVENELRIAHNIQMSMLRKDFPAELCAVLQPMKEVGGDLYDFYQKDDNLYFIIGDVSGKGLPATMMMAATVNLFRMAARYFNTPIEIVEEINEVISERNPNLIFVTAFVGKLDMRHGLLTYCNAGHNPPIVNNAYLQTDPDIPIGYDAEYSFRQYGMLFPEGSRIVLYTDGVTESRNEEGDFMGTDYLLSLVQKHQQEDVSDMTRNIINDTHLFSEDADQRDDITLMCIANNISAQSHTLVISNDIEELQRVKPLVREYCECLGCDKRLTRKIVLALEEALANVINYAYPKGELGSIDIDILAMPAVSEQIPGDITFVISDSGEPFNPLEKQSVDVEQAMDDRQVGGLGIYLYQQLMDTVLYKRTDDGRNVLTLTKHICKG